MPLDLNLLTALDALLEEGSVTGAADRLHLSAPAMSRTLGRIRRATGDQVLVRTGRTMAPTPYASAVQEEVHALVAAAQALLTPAREVDLGALTRTFTVRGHDAVVTALAPELLARVSTAAPGVQLRLLAEASTDSDDLRAGRTDLEVTSAAPASPDVRSETIGHDHLVVALRAQHPDAAGELDLARYAAARHVSASRRGRLHDRIDDALAGAGLSRRVVATAPTTATALHLAAGDDLLVIVPERTTAAARAALGLLVRPLPLPVPPVPVVLAWHRRYDGDPAHTWLRAQVRAAVASLWPAAAADG